MRVAVVDLGTITTRLLVADVDDGRVEEVSRRTEITRLGTSSTRPSSTSATSSRVVMDAGLPRPETNIVVGSGLDSVRIAMGWSQFKVGLIYKARSDSVGDTDAINESAAAALRQLEGWMTLHRGATASPLADSVRRPAHACVALSPHTLNYSGSRATGHDMQRGPPRPVPNSDAAIAQHLDARILKAGIGFRIAFVGDDHAAAPAPACCCRRPTARARR